MLFAQFWQWLSDRLTDYVSVNVAATAAAIEPAAVSLAVIYVMVWGFLHLRGAVEEPVLTGAVRIVRLVVVFGVGLRLWQYNAVIVDTFFEAPVQLAARLAGAADPVATVDALWDRGGTVAAFLWEKGGVFNGDVGYYLAAAIVYVLMGAVCVYTLFLMALARVALAVLLAIGPLFIVLLLFDGTKRFFEAWVAQLANYALVGVLAVLVATLLHDGGRGVRGADRGQGRGDPDGRCARHAAGGGAGAADPAAGDADRGAAVGWRGAGEPRRDGCGRARGRGRQRAGVVRGSVGAGSGGDRIRIVAVGRWAASGSSLAPASRRPAKVTPVWRSAGRGG